MRRLRKQGIVSIGFGILLILLACNFPTRGTPTPEAVCTPPACEGDGVLQCPEGEACPGGCGFICATPTQTQEPPADGDTVTPTETPQIMCTPPACQGDEVIICPDTCPGGCGSICASPTPPPPTETFTPSPTTESSACELPACPAPQVVYCPGACPDNCGLVCVTPTPAPPEIVEFSTDRTTLTEGESVQITWQTRNATEISILWPGAGGTMEGLGEIDPESGTATITPYGSPIHLEVRNDVGSATADLTLDVQCANAWVPELAEARENRCPKPAETTWAAQQPFERGFMIWMEFNQTIYVFYDQGDPKTYATYPDTFEEGKDLERDPSIKPPSGLDQPIRGFGKVWRENPEVRTKIGWATAPESGFESWQQRYQGFGLHNVTLWMEGFDGTVYELDPMGQIWDVYVP